MPLKDALPGLVRNSCCQVCVENRVMPVCADLRGSLVSVFGEEARDWDGTASVWHVKDLIRVNERVPVCGFPDQLCTTFRFEESWSLREIEETSLAELLSRDHQESDRGTIWTQLHKAANASQKSTL